MTPRRAPREMGSVVGISNRICRVADVVRFPVYHAHDDARVLHPADIMSLYRSRG